MLIGIKNRIYETPFFIDKQSKFTPENNPWLTENYNSRF